MSIILQENKWAERMIETRSLGKKPYETLRRVARYYFDEGFSKGGVRKELDSFMIKCDPSVSLPKWSDTIERAISRASKYPAVNMDSVNIYEEEMHIINSLNGKQIKRLAFTLLCLSKFWYAINPKCDHWVSNKDTEIMSLANINTSIKRQSIMYKELRDNGLVQFSKMVDNTNVKVCFAKSEGLVILKVSDFRNLGYQYLMYNGEPYYECKCCGLVVRSKEPNKGRNSKYCTDCAVEMRTKQNVNAVMRQRYKGNNQ